MNRSSTFMPPITVGSLDDLQRAHLFYDDLQSADAKLRFEATFMISALKGYNVVTAADGWAGYQGPSLLDLLEHLPNTAAETELPFSFAVQLIE